MLMALRAISKNSPAHQLTWDPRKRKFLKGSPKNSMNFFILTHVTLKKIWTDFEEIHDLATDSIGGPSEVFFSNPWSGLICFAQCVRSNQDMRDHESLTSFHTFFIKKTMATSKSFLAKEWKKNSDDAKRVLSQKSNKLHAARGILLTQSGLGDLQHHEREKALYTKRKLGNQDQWKEERAESLISKHFCYKAWEWSGWLNVCSHPIEDYSKRLLCN